MKQELNNLNMKELIEKFEERYNSDFYSIISNLGKDWFVECCKNNYYNNQNVSFVYFLKNNDTGLIKIGCTKDLLERMKNIKNIFRNMLGIEPNLQLQYLILCNNGEEHKVEKQIHKAFCEYRTFGEWFKGLEDCDYYVDLINPEIYLENGTGIGVYDFLIEDKYNEELYRLSFHEFLNLNYISKNTKEIINNVIKETNHNADIFKFCKSHKNIIETFNKIYKNIVSLKDKEDIYIYRKSLLNKISSDDLNNIVNTLNLQIK